MRRIALLLALLVAGVLSAQSSRILDDALFTTGRYLNMRIPSRAKVVVLSFLAPTEALSRYVTEELTRALDRNPMLTVIEQPDDQAQISEKMSNAALPIGRRLGALVVVVGSITSDSAGTGSLLLRTKAISVQNAQVYWTGSYSIQPDQTLKRLSAET
jgi:TolB-like protein